MRNFGVYCLGAPWNELFIGRAFSHYTIVSILKNKCRLPHPSRFEAVKKPSRKLIDRKAKRGKLGA